jgi:2-polyprenyl-6-methoxyphenol hydroxylase-like FAD-dependent oxidoreductase
VTGPRVLIAGGGIGGLAMALTLHQIGIPFTVFESARELAPLGVGISVQPNAVRELYDLGIGPDNLDTVGVPTREWALVGLNGNDIYSEPRGLFAGYRWPQYSAHRGKLQMLLYRKLIERAGQDCIKLGHKVIGYDIAHDGTVSVSIRLAGGETASETGTLLIGADGIHSEIRARMHPKQPPINWGGAVPPRPNPSARGRPSWAWAPIDTGWSFTPSLPSIPRRALPPSTGSPN